MSVLADVAAGTEVVDDNEDSTRDSTTQVATPRAERFFAIAAIVSCLLSGLFVVAAARRGMALDDEGLYLLLLDSPERALRSASGFHILLGPLFELTGKSPVTWRLVRALFDVSSDVVFALAVVHFLRARSAESTFHRGAPAIALVAGLTSVGFTSWAWTPNGFGYNELSSMWSSLLAALILVLVAKPAAGGKKVFVQAVVFGALLTPTAITRFTAAFAIMLGAIAVFVLLLGWRKTMKLSVGILVGAILSALLIHTTIFDLGEVVHGIRSATVEVAAETHSPLVILRSYWRAYSGTLSSYLYFGAVLAAAAWAFQRWRSRQVSATTPVVLITFGSLVLLFLQRARGADRLFALHNWAAVLLTLGLLVAVIRLVQVAVAAGVMSAVRSVILPVVLLAIPLGTFAGTNNALLLNSMLLAQIWVGATVILGAQFHFKGNLGAFVTVGLLALSGSVPIMTYEAVLGSEQWFEGAQDVRVERGRFAGVNVDQETHDLLYELDDLSVSLDPNPTVISLWKKPGVTYALGGHGIGFPWYSNNGIEAAAATIDGACRDGFEPAEQVVIVTEAKTAEEMGPVHGALSRCGVEFPDAFNYLSTIRAPGDTELDIYVAK